jgi:molecular chaperone DnaK
MMIDRPVGIDLGTTNSEIAQLEVSEQNLVMYADRFGRKTIPSAVAWYPSANSFLVGHAARARRGQDPACVESIKRKMGQNVRVSVGPHALLPEEISAKVLAELRTRMRETLQSSAGSAEVRVERAVITVPAYFDAPQVEATRRAGVLAGFDVIGMLQEPTAAAIYHTWRHRLGDGNFLVYDLGGGTFDVSVLRCVGGEYQVLAIDGDNYLGGDDFDRRFAEWLRLELVKRGYSLDLDVRSSDDDRRRFLALVHLGQQIKESLSTSEVVPISKQDILVDKEGQAVSLDAEIGRAEYDGTIRTLVDATFDCSSRALARSKEIAGVAIEDIDHIVLVGGSTRVPLVVRRVIEELSSRCKSSEPLRDEVDTCVALGAAIHAAQLGGVRLAESQVQVLFSSPLVTSRARAKLALQVEKAPQGVVVLAVERGGVEIGKATLQAIPSERLRLEVDAGDAEQNEVDLVVRDSEGVDKGHLPFCIYRGDVRPRASALSRPSVVAKDIAIEVLRGGRRERKVLLARGTGLPEEVLHTFATSDQSGIVVLRLLQNRLPIKSLTVEVPKELAVGAPVELQLRCDEAMRLEVKATVGGRAVTARIEGAPTPRFDPEGSVDRLLEEAEDAGRSLWGGNAAYFRRESTALSTSIRELTHIDPDKLEVLCHRLRGLIDDYRGPGGEELSPPMRVFEESLDALRRVVYRSPDRLLGMDRTEWDRRITDLEERAQEAWSEGDSSSWRRVCNEAQALFETAHQEEFSALRLDDPAYVERRYRNAAAYASRVLRGIESFVVGADQGVRSLQAAEQERLRDWMQDHVFAVLDGLRLGDGADLPSIRRQLDDLHQEIERIEMALERIPQLGVVADRGG